MRREFSAARMWQQVCRIPFVVLIVAAQANAAEFLQKANDLLSIRSTRNDFSLQLSGLVDLEGYFIDQRAPGLIYTDDRFLFNPRFTLFADAQWTKHFYFFGQMRVDRGFDPSDSSAEIRLDEYFLRYTPLNSAHLNFQIGKFATVVGTWVPRHYSWDNPFINAPLPYENLTGIWDTWATPNADVLLFWAHVKQFDSHNYSDKNLRLPIIWGPSYASGFAVSGSIDKFDYAIELKNAALASRPETWDVTERRFSDPTVSTRIGFRPNAMWNLGLSASSGSYLRSEALPSLRRGSGFSDYSEHVLAQDVSFAWHHLQLWSEFYEARFEVPKVGDADTFAYYVEAKYKMTPQLFGALRWNQQLFGTVPVGTRDRQWGNDIWRIDAALGYRFTNYLQTKLQYSFNHQNAELEIGEQLLAVQVTLKF